MLPTLAFEEGPDRQMTASVIFLAIKIIFLSFHIHIFDSDLHFELIYWQRYGFIYSWEWELSMSLSPKKSSEIIE